jgi:probable rRNA maturation factor
VIQVLIRPRFEALVDPEQVEQVAHVALQMESAPPQVSLSVVITDDDEIQSLNRQFRGIDAPTDVLSFADDAPDAAFVDAPDETPYLGDVILSFPRAQAQAAEQGHGTAQEVRLLIVHGILHLLGYDHAEPDEKDTMWARQDAILAKAADG